MLCWQRSSATMRKVFTLPATYPSSGLLRISLKRWNWRYWTSFSSACRLHLLFSPYHMTVLFDTVTTHLKYWGISLYMENSENSVQRQRKIVTSKIFSVCHSNFCIKLLFWTSNEQSRVLLTWSEFGGDLLAWNDPWWRLLLQLLFVTITYGK